MKFIISYNDRLKIGSNIKHLTLYNSIEQALSQINMYVRKTCAFYYLITDDDGILIHTTPSHKDAKRIFKIGQL